MTEDTTENGLIREASEPLTINEATRGTAANTQVLFIHLLAIDHLAGYPDLCAMANICSWGAALTTDISPIQS